MADKSSGNASGSAVEIRAKHDVAAYHLPRYVIAAASRSEYTLRRIFHSPLHASSQQSQPLTNPPLNSARPRSQIEAMPPFGPAQTPATFFTPVYDSAIRHPVFFTQNLKKPPFPIPQVAAHSWNPVASGYVAEQRRSGEVAGKTKL
ncbi:hypothetical protein CFE70_008139 [Pyrenophora teres f. teres 0-1]